MSTPETNQLPPDKRSELLSRYRRVLDFSTKESRLEYIFLHLGGDHDLTELTGWDVLDIGCGSPESTCADYGIKEQFAAWFPRVCAAYGASVIGIDMYDQDLHDAGIYTHIVTDLNNLLVGDNLEMLFHGKKFDLIHTNAVIDDRAPGYTYSSSIGEGGTSYFFGSNTLSDKVQTHIANLKQQATQLLKPHGILSMNDEVYTLESPDVLKRHYVPKMW